MNIKKDFLFFQNERDIQDLKQMLNESCALFAQRPAFWIKKYKGSEFLPITYEMLKNDVDALGTELLARGFSGSRIALIGSGCYEWITAYLAVVNGVGTVVPIDKDLEPEVMQNLINRAECDAVFFSSDIGDKADSLRGIRLRVEMDYYGDRTEFGESLSSRPRAGAVHWKQLVESGEKLVRSGDHSYTDCSIDADVMSVLLFTSGTTGIPKGVMLSHRNIALTIRNINRIFGVRREDINLSVLPIHHTYACTCNLTFLYCGASTAYFEGLKYIIQNLNEVRATYFVLVPLIAEMLYDRIWKEARKAGKEKLLRRMISVNKKTRAIGLDAGRILVRTATEKFGGRLRTLVSAASAISPAVLRNFEDMGLHVIQAYGLTETSPFISATPVRSKDRYKKAGSVGLCIDDGEVKIVRPDEDGIGEICYRGPNVMLGYYKMPQETEAVMEDGWINTGDLGFLDRDGWLYITGRKKNVIVTKNGENIYPEEIESVVNNSPCVTDCMVYAAKKDDSEIVGIQIIPDLEYISDIRGEELTSQQLQKIMKDLIADINENLPSYKRIRSVVVRKEDFARTTTQKIIRQKNISDDEQMTDR